MAKYNVQKYLETIRVLLDDYRFNHSICVADEAKRLCERYGGDAEKAYVTGLLHDITKNFKREEHLRIFESSAIILSELEMNSDKLWHSLSGAEYVRLNFGLDDDIISAIKYHTTARAGMSHLEKIIYLADYTSADRNYPDVDVMRRLVDNSIEEAMYYALKYTISDLLNKSSAVHPNTFEAYNEICLKNKKGN